MAKVLSVEDMRQAKLDSPRISILSWGRIEVDFESERVIKRNREALVPPPDHLASAKRS